MTGKREREREGVNYSYVMVYTHNLYRRSCTRDM